jgi:hypothetical protein
LQIGGNNSFSSLQFRFDAGFSFKKKLWNDNSFLPYFLVSPCMCVWRNNRKSLSGLCVYYTMRQPHLSTEMCRHRERKPTHTPPKTWGTWKGT